MARHRRGVDNAQVFPVIDQGGYMAVSQSGPQPVQPFPQQFGVAGPAKK